MKKDPSLSPDQRRTLEVFRELWRYAPVDDKEEQTRLKNQAAKQKQFGRVDAIAKEILPTLSPDELKRLRRHIRNELDTRQAAPKPAQRPKRSKEDREEDERLAYDMHTALMNNPVFAALLGVTSSEKADQLVGLTMYADKRTAQRYRKAYADKLDKKGDNKSDK